MADISKKLQKGHNFWQFQHYDSGKRPSNQRSDLIFFICFSSPNCLGNLFLRLKIVKIHFHGAPYWPILICKIPEFWRQKLWDQVFLRLDSGNVHIEENKKPGLTFSTQLRINSKNFREILWSNGLYLTMLWAIMTHNDPKYSHYDPLWPKT